MIKVVAKSKVDIEKLEEILALYQELVAKTREETGCISYDLFQDTKDPSVLTMIETWENQACLEAHFTAEHVLRIVPMIRPYRVEPSALDVYEQVI
ncbi:MAG: putative quinol monooxygenase [Erysipelotrichaceae bacterium]